MREAAAAGDRGVIRMGVGAIRIVMGARRGGAGIARRVIGSTSISGNETRRQSLDLHASLLFSFLLWIGWSTGVDIYTLCAPVSPFLRLGGTDQTRFYEYNGLMVMATMIGRRGGGGFIQPSA